MTKISVIVPVYKVEDCLEFCVDSILNQTFADFELILVDDGSPDNCGAMCDEYAAKDSRVRVVHRENGGLSAARNSGMDIMRGEYIAFIDSDDAVMEDYLEVLFSACKETDADIAVCRFEEFEDGNIPDLQSTADVDVQNTILCGKDACLEVYKGSRYVSINACCKLFKASIIEDMRFPEGKLHEDQAFTPIAYFKAQKVASVDKTMYLYRVRAASITHEMFNVRRYDDIWAIDNCIKYFEEKNERIIADAAREKRERLICIYSIYAKRDGVEIPEEYRRRTAKALRYLHGKVSRDKFEYYLAQVNPKYVRGYEYAVKLKKLLKQETAK